MGLRGQEEGQSLRIPPQNFHDIIHGSQCLAHHISIPLSFTGNDVNLSDSGPTIYIPVEYPYMTKTT